jgi:hypothetical protein
MLSVTRSGHRRRDDGEMDAGQVAAGVAEPIGARAALYAGFG